MASSLAGRLLVVDWDYFFPNLMMAVGSGRDAFAYDWHHIESGFFINNMWQSRAETFIQARVPLPRCERMERFWSRFDLSGVSELFVCESNIEAGAILPSKVFLDAGGWEEVWLFDAHHDCGYRAALDRERDGYDCGSWMVEHAERGSTLHVRYPWWRATRDGVTFADIEPEPWVSVDRQLDRWPDAGEELPDGWDAVVVCRSGAWVPSWNDDQFENFVEAAGVAPIWIDSNFPQGPREQPNLVLAQAVVDEWAKHRAQVYENAKGLAVQGREGDVE